MKKHIEKQVVIEDIKIPVKQQVSSQVITQQRPINEGRKRDNFKV